ncbi:bifunctional DNA primase/polymerase [Arthrobacter sp. TB 23]|uniref:bifunctional DNA primase/polymerase n=1 Tax=Arthrobacter sp. TB 23 TaxID=494419 RepID=UPI003FCE4DF8
MFPCVPGGKRPIAEHGLLDATTDPGQVDAWWRQTPTANIGLPTGAASGVVVVDVDVHGPVNGYEAFARAGGAGLVHGWEFLVRSPSGGMHAYFPAILEADQRSWQAARAGIDFRGDGGYIIAPPSRRFINGTEIRYEVYTISTGPATSLDADRLRDFLDPRPAPRRPASQDVAREADLSRLAGWVAARGEGERNRGLFWAACRLAENGSPVSETLDVLSAAASEAGLGEREITATVRSAYRTTLPRRRESSSSSVQGSSPLATDGGFARDTTRQSPLRVRGL